MTQTYFVQTETLRIYFKKPKINFPNLIKFPNGFAQIQSTQFFTSHRLKISCHWNFPFFQLIIMKLKGHPV